MKKNLANETERPALLPAYAGPQDLKTMSREELSHLAEEIRALLVRVVEQNGGHLASNLGVVELTLALHRVFNTPKDHLIFDVGHQSYVHKILTDRKDRFESLRRVGGLSGFESREESLHDCFGTGHSSTSLSAALGFAMADKLSGSDAWTVAVVGDGAFTGGMIHEALNNCEKNLRLLIIINENEMSISPNIGRFATSLAKTRLGAGYLSTKHATSRALLHIPLIGKPLLRFLKTVKKKLKNSLYNSNYFENLGLRYLGPIDGNDREMVERALREAVRKNESVVLHIKTKKGKGYAPAEKDPGRFHGMAPSGTAASEQTFSSVCGEFLDSAADRDDRICAITAAMADGTGLCPFRAHHPERFFDVGIAEEHAATFAAGLAAEGCKPFFAVYSTFLQRSYDSLIHDIALQNLPVRLCIDRAGLNARDGATHHGIYDVAMLSQLPIFRIECPLSFASLRETLERAEKTETPFAVRYASGGENETILSHFDFTDPTEKLHADFAPEDGVQTVILTYGAIAEEAIGAQKILAEKGIRAGILLTEVLAPYASLADRLLPYLPNAGAVFFLEEGVRYGGAGMILRGCLEERGGLDGVSYRVTAIHPDLNERAKTLPIRKAAGLDAASIATEIEETVSGKNA